ncbi:MAG: type 4a pilus biogenesis protein PilO [Candidatus Pacebacteria bacterium]|nr:type 4a pilus biogenesis protein PilO [Candidatus Paceibacterota bacterium]
MVQSETRKDQINKLLDSFYHNPIAVVSFELFLSISVVIFFAVFAIRPTLLTMADLVKEIEDKRKLDTQLAQKVAALGTAQAQYLAVSNRIFVLEEALPNGGDVVNTLKIIERVASDQDLVINNMTLLEIPENPDPAKTIAELERKAMPIQLTVIGPYSAIRSFAEGLRNSRRTFIIERITFSTEDNRGQKSLEATMLISAPYFGEK